MSVNKLKPFYLKYQWRWPNGWKTVKWKKVLYKRELCVELDSNLISCVTVGSQVAAPEENISEQKNRWK